jgi:hypothetical protein
MLVKIPKRYYEEGRGKWRKNYDHYPDLDGKNIEFPFPIKKLPKNDFSLRKKEFQLIMINNPDSIEQRQNQEQFFEEDFFINNFEELIKHSTDREFFQKIVDKYTENAKVTLPNIKKIAEDFFLFLLNNKFFPNIRNSDIIFTSLSFFSLFINEDKHRTDLVRRYRELLQDKEGILDLTKPNQFLQYLRAQKGIFEQARALVIKEQETIDLNKIKLEDILLPELHEQDIENEQIWTETDQLRKFGLKENPFSESQSLQNIEAEYYSDIVVRTGIFQHFITLIETSIEKIFNKKYLILGINGIGKTTLFDYVRYLLTIFHQDIIPIYISIQPVDDHIQILNEFKVNLKTNLLSTIQGKLNQTIDDVHLQFEQREILFILHKLCEIGNYKGICVFIDNLNHFPDLTDKCLDFLESLNILNDNLKANSTLNFTYFISGTDAWKTKVETNPRLSPYANHIFSMPTISFNEACEMVEKRFRYASIDSSKPAKCKSDFIKDVFLLLQKMHPSGVTFRNLISYLNKKLQSGEFDSLEMTIDQDLISLSIIYAHLLTLDDVFDKFKFLYQILETKYKSRKIKDAHIKKIAELMVLLYKYQYLSEDSERLANLKEYAQILKKVGFLEYGTIGRKQVLVLSKGLKSFLDYFKTNWKIEPRSYLAQIIGFENRFVSYKEEELSRLDAIIHSIELMYPEVQKNNMIRVRNEYVQIIDAITNKKFNPSKEQITDAYKNIFRLIQTIYIHSLPTTEQTNTKFRLDERSFNKLIEKYSESWISNSGRVEQIYAFDDEYKKLDLKALDKEKLYSFFSNYRIIFQELILDLSKNLKNDKVFMINDFPFRDITKKELNAVRMNFKERDLNLAINNFERFILPFLEDYLKLLNSILYGEAKWRKGLTQTLNERIKGSESIGGNLTIQDFLEIVEKNSNFLRSQIPEEIVMIFTL